MIDFIAQELANLEETKVYRTSDGRTFHSKAAARSHIMREALLHFLVSLDVYGVGSGHSDHQVDLELLGDRLIDRKDELKAILSQFPV